MIKKLMIWLSLFVFLAGMTSATERGAFPSVGIGARPLAMGGAFIAVADSADAIYWNPAGVAQLSSTQLSSMQTDLFGLGIKYNWLSAVVPVEKYTIGLAYNGLDASQAFGEFPYREGSLLANVAGEVSLFQKKLCWGANIKYNYLKGGSDFLNTNQKGIGFDLGILCHSELFNAGLVIRDLFTRLAGEVVEDGVSEEVVNVLRPDVALGVAVYTGPVLWTADVSELASAPKIHLGVEYAVNHQIQIRGGYNAGMFTAGLGIRTGNWVLDYAYNTHQAGDAQRFSIGFKF